MSVSLSSDSSAAKKVLEKAEDKELRSKLDGPNNAIDARAQSIGKLRKRSKNSGSKY